MAGIKITAKGASFVGRAVTVNLPLTDGLIGSYFGGDGALVNMVKNGASITLVGSPVSLNVFATELDKNNYVDTGILPDTVESTLFVVTKRFRGTAYSEPLGCWTNSISGGAAILGRALLLTPNGGVQAILNTYSSAANATAVASVSLAADAGIPNPSTTPDNGAWRALVQRISSTKNEVRDLTAGTHAELAYNEGHLPDTRGVESFKLGLPKTASLDGSGKSHIMMAFLFNRALTDDELGILYDYAKSYASRDWRGQVV